jgi:hypothetical protein
LCTGCALGSRPTAFEHLPDDWNYVAAETDVPAGACCVSMPMACRCC